MRFGPRSLPRISYDMGSRTGGGEFEGPSPSKREEIEFIEISSDDDSSSGEEGLRRAGPSSTVKKVEGHPRDRRKPYQRPPVSTANGTSLERLRSEDLSS